MGVQEALRVQGCAPVGVHSYNLGTAAGRDVAHALTEDAVHPHHDRVTHRHHVHESGLHAG